jgi:hypothetical protein
MGESQFCYWIQGYFELLTAAGGQVPTSAADAFYDCILERAGLVELKSMSQNASSPLSAYIKEIGFLAKYRMPLAKIQAVVHKCFESLDRIQIDSKLSIHQTFGSWVPEKDNLRC